MITITIIVAIIDTMFILCFFSWLLCNSKREIVYIFNHRLRHQNLNRWTWFLQPFSAKPASLMKKGLRCHEKLCQEVLTFHNQNNHTISIKNHFTSCQGAFLLLKMPPFHLQRTPQFFTPQHRTTCTFREKKNSTVASGSSGPWGHRAAKSVTWQHA